jgi:hypothetical protein
MHLVRLGRGLDPDFRSMDSIVPMQYVTIIVAVVALLLSASSLAVSILTYRRDRSKVRAWSMIVWRENGPEPSTPVMQVRIMNVGRRPIALMHLVKKAGRDTWSRTLMRPQLNAKDAFEAIRELERTSLAHIAAIKLAEGEVFEIAFRPEDCDEFIAVHLERPAYANTLLIEDVVGSRYPVQNSAEHLKEMIAAWKPVEAQVSWMEMPEEPEPITGVRDDNRPGR